MPKPVPKLIPSPAHPLYSLLYSLPAKLLLGALTVLNLAGTALAQPEPAPPAWQTLPTPAGSRVEVLVASQAPSGVNREQSVLVLAPGSSCNARRPFFNLIGEELLNQARAAGTGLTLVRMEWGYCNQGTGKPSQDLSQEADELRAVLAYTRRLPGVDPARIYLGGKSLGSILAWEVFRKDPGLRAAALLTPVCSRDSDEQGKPLPAPVAALDENYPGLSADSRQLLFLLGDQDGLCYLPLLYQGLQASGGRAAVAVLGGGHGLNLSDRARQDDPVASERNLRTAGRVLYDWLARQSAR